MRMRKRSTTIALVAATAMLAVACGGDGGGQAAEGDTGTNGSGEAQQGGTLIVQQPFDACCGTPYGTQDPSVMQVFSGTVFSKLVEFESGEDLVEPEITPDLAESWEISDDGLTYTFQLRDDVTWHDIEPLDGRPFVADDVVAHFEKLREGEGVRYPDDDPGSMIYPHAYMVDMVSSIQAPDDHTVVFELDQVYGPFLENMAHHFNYIMPPEAYEEYDPNEVWIGTGPFRVESYSPDTEWVLERNPDYFEEGLPLVDRIELPIISDWSAVQSALRSGRLDLGETASTDAAEETGGDGSGIETHEQSDLPITFFLNTGVEPFDDLQVRQAIMMAIDWETMGESIRGQITTSSFVRPDLGAPALSPEEVAEIRPYDPERAQELLAEAGYPDGFETRLLIQELGEDDVREGQWIAQDLGEIGIDVELEITDPGTAVQRRRDFQFEMHKAARSVHLADQVFMDFLPGALDNHAQIDDPELVAMYEESRATLDDADRAEIYKDMQRYLETEVAAVMYPYHYTRYTLVNERVQGFETSFIYKGRRYADVWLED